MREVIETAIQDALVALGFPRVVFTVEHPADVSHGDYASNVALKAFGPIEHGQNRKMYQAHSGIANSKKPGELAAAIKAELDGKIEYVDDITIADPGFLNFHLARDFFTAEAVRITTKKEDWGKNDSWKDKTVIVEYTDPNPFKELHIGHLVPNALGESLARLFMYAGAETKRVTFQGDVGMHVAKAIWGLRNNNVAVDQMTETDIGNAYATGAKAFEDNEESAAEIKELNKTIYNRDDEEINKLYDKGKEISLQYFERAYTILGTHFDHNFFESVTGPVGLELVKAHIGDVFEESDGAIIFKGEKYGLHTRVFVNNEGLPTYETKDVGLIKCKHDWCPFDLTVTVTGTEQQEYFKVTTKASELIQPDLAGKVELVPNGMLRLSTGKMSSRTGDIVRALELIGNVTGAAQARMDESLVSEERGVGEAIAVGAIKYTILKIAPGKDIVFDLEKSISFEGDSGPYLQYTHARICSVLEKAKAEGVVASIAHAPAEPYVLEKILYQFPEMVEKALAERAPHHLVVYLTELAGAFNTFYAHEKIADASDEYAPYKLVLAEAVMHTLKNGLWLLGIKAPERM